MVNHEKDFKVVYEVDEGCVGGYKPRSFYIPTEDLEEDMSDKTLASLFRECLEEDFLQNVYPVSQDEEAFIEWAKEQIALRNSETED